MCARAETAYVDPDMWDLWLTLRGMWFRRGVSLAVLVVASLVDDAQGHERQRLGNGGGIQAGRSR